jgi:hypothetical protein
VKRAFDAQRVILRVCWVSLAVGPDFSHEKREERRERKRENEKAEKQTK